jgi:type II secretory pathway component GspD/PulD (secretin)
MRFRPLVVPSLILLPLVSCRTAPQEAPQPAETRETTGAAADARDPWSTEQLRGEGESDLVDVEWDEDAVAWGEELPPAGVEGEPTDVRIAEASVQDPDDWQDDEEWQEEPVAAEPPAAVPSGRSPEAMLRELGYAAPGQDEWLESERARIELLRQRAQVLAAQFIALGDQSFDRGDLQDARYQYAEALEVQPSNEEARQKLNRVLALLGDDDVGIADDLLRDAVQREVVRRSEARLAAQQAVVDGDNARRAGDFDRAVERYREAELILGWHPLIAEGSLDELIVRRKLESALEERENARLAAEEARRRDADAAREREEQEQRDYRANQLRTLYGEAHAAFLREDYALAEQLSRQILLLDPGNEQATEMRDIAQTARHQKTNEQLRQRYREQWILTFDDLDMLAVPQTDSIVFDDIRRWSEVERRQPHGFTQTVTTQDQEREEIIRRLRDVRVAVQFGVGGDGAPLREVARYLQQLTNVNFVITPSVAELDEQETSIDLTLPERSVYNILELIAATSENLRWRIEDGVVKFVTASDLAGGQTLRMYPVSSLISPIPDFPSREINVEPSNGIDYPDEELSEREALVITRDELETLLMENVAPETWNADPRNSLRITEGGTLIVTALPEVHAEIESLLEDLRESTGIMVDINARFLNVEDNFLEDIGVDFRGLGAPGLGTNEFFNDFGDPSVIGDLQSVIGQDLDTGVFYDRFDGDIKSRIEHLYDLTLGEPGGLQNSGGLSFQWTYLGDLQLEMILRAVSKKERIELVTNPRVLVFNTARANLSVLNQMAYVQDYDVQIAQGASIADPIVRIVEEGVVLDVRPVVSADRRFITLELRPTVAQLVRPMRTFTTTLANQSAVTIQLPEMSVQRARTTVPMPDGGTVMLGGLKVHNEQRLASGVPVLNKIPVLRFFFERRGNYVSNRKLLILIEARIVIPEEHEPTQAQMNAYRGIVRR